MLLFTNFMASQSVHSLVAWVLFMLCVAWLCALISLLYDLVTLLYGLMTLLYDLVTLLYNLLV